MLGLKLVRLLSTLSCASQSTATAQLALALLRSDTLQAYAQLLAADLAALRAAGGSSSDSSTCSANPSSTTPSVEPLACTPVSDPPATAASPSCPRATAVSGTSPTIRGSVLAEHAATITDATPLYSGIAATAASALMHTLEAVEALCFLCNQACHERHPDLDPALRRRLIEVLLTALADSCLLEHACRLGMALQEVAAACSPEHAAAMATTHTTLGILLSEVLPSTWLADQKWELACDSVTALPPRSPPVAPPQRAALRRVLSGPCLQLYLGWALAAPLSAAAGRPLYGLPPRLALAGGSAPSAHGAAAVERAVWAGSEVWMQLLGEAAAAEASSGRSAPPCPGAAQDAAEGRAAAGTRVAHGTGRLPYKLRHVVGLLLDAMRRVVPQPRALIYRRAVHSLVVCVAAAVGRVQPTTAAAWLPGVWPMLLHHMLAARPQDAHRGAILAGGLLLASLGVARDSVPRHADAGGLSPSLRAALDASLLPTLNRLMRTALEAQAGTGDREGAAWRVSLELVEFALRRPGVWPALLAHGPPAQVALLIVTIRRVTVAVSDNDKGSLWDMQLIALLEQAAAALQGPGGEAATRGSGGASAPRAGSSNTGGGSGAAAVGWAIAERYCRQLTANRGISGLGSGVAAGAAAGPGPGQALCADSLADGPTWEHIRHAGGCPPPGSPAAEQQRRLAVFAATQWLPLLTGARLGGRLTACSSHRAYLVLYHWMMLAARERCAARGAGEEPASCGGGGESGGGGGGGSESGDRGGGGGEGRSYCNTAGAAAHDSWSALLRDCFAVVHATNHDMAAEAPAAAAPMMDLAELLMAGAPGHMADMVHAPGVKRGFQARGDGAPRPRVSDVLAAFVLRYRRHGLLAAMQQVVQLGAAAGAEGVPPDWRPPAPGLPAAAALSRPGSWRPLPPPCEVRAEVLELLRPCVD